MKLALSVVVLIVVLIALITVFVKGCSTEAFVLDYEKMIFLDAEALAEGGIGEKYSCDVAPALSQYVSTTADINETFDTSNGSYVVESQGQTYVIFSPGMDISEGQNWGNAMFALFDIVNCQLRESDYEFYAINGGNDLGGMFLTHDIYMQATKEYKNRSDWSYLPKLEHPWYGQPHDK